MPVKFEGDAGILGRCQGGLEAFLGAQPRLLQPFDGQPVGGFGYPAESGVEHVHLSGQVRLLFGRRHGDAFEAAAGDDDRVPVPSGPTPTGPRPKDSSNGPPSKSWPGWPDAATPSLDPPPSACT